MAHNTCSAVRSSWSRYLTASGQLLTSCRIFASSLGDRLQTSMSWGPIEDADAASMMNLTQLASSQELATLVSSTTWHGSNALSENVLYRSETLRSINGSLLTNLYHGHLVVVVATKLGSPAKSPRSCDVMFDSHDLINSAFEVVGPFSPLRFSRFIHSQKNLARDMDRPQNDHDGIYRTLIL